LTEEQELEVSMLEECMDAILILDETDFLDGSFWTVGVGH
jgi:hypothetical protein